MSASQFEQDLATSKGVRLLFDVTPKSSGKGTLTLVQNGNGEEITLPADQVMRAIGQTLDGSPQGPKTSAGRIDVDAHGRTSISGVWAGGDCASGGDDLTVTAVAEGRDAAEDIHNHLTSEA